MANDDPTSLRMGFGYHDARRAGLGGVRADRSPRQVNQIINERKDENEALRQIAEAGQDPEWRRYLKHRREQGCSAQEIATELGWMKRYKWARSHFSVAWCLKYHWPYSN
jgi:hypothetical protein